MLNVPLLVTSPLIQDHLKESKEYNSTFAVYFDIKTNKKPISVNVLNGV